MELSTTMKRLVALKDAWFRGKLMENIVEDYHLPDYYILDDEDDWDSLPCSLWKCGIVGVATISARKKLSTNSSKMKNGKSITLQTIFLALFVARA